MTKENFRIFAAIYTGVILATALFCFMIFFLNIELARMRNESPTQKLYNKCIEGNSYSNNAAGACAYVLKGSKP